MWRAGRVCRGTSRRGGERRVDGSPTTRRRTRGGRRGCSTGPRPGRAGWLRRCGAPPNDAKRSSAVRSGDVHNPLLLANALGVDRCHDAADERPRPGLRVRRDRTGVRSHGMAHGPNPCVVPGQLKAGEVDVLPNEQAQARPTRCSRLRALSGAQRLGRTPNGRCGGGRSPGQEGEACLTGRMWYTPRGGRASPAPNGGVRRSALQCVVSARLLSAGSRSRRGGSGTRRPRRGRGRPGALRRRTRR